MAIFFSPRIMQNRIIKNHIKIDTLVFKHLETKRKFKIKIKLVYFFQCEDTPLEPNSIQFKNNMLPMLM